MYSQLYYRIRGVKNAFILLRSGRWREFVLRLRISLGQIDLKNDASENVTSRTHYYVDSSGPDFDRIMENFPLSANDAIIDYGCGKGGALISFSKYPFSKIAGVEISPDIIKIAKENLKKLKVDNIEIVCSDAAEYQKLDTYNYVYFFNPFPCNVMAAVVDNLEKSLARKPRKITIIYLHPFCQQVFEERGFFKIQELPHFEYKCFVYSNVR